MIRLQAERNQYVTTFFLRNRAESEVMVRLLQKKVSDSTLNLTVVACSKGAEVYSLARAIRLARPDLRLNIHAVDISPEIVAFAAKGVYSFTHPDSRQAYIRDDDSPNGEVARNTSRDQNAWMFEYMSSSEIDEMFDVQADQASIKPWLRQGITWLCGDAGDPSLAARIGPQDVVVANRFLCHMRPAAARVCLRNIGSLITPGGYLFVSGVDLDVRTQVARELGWLPVQDLLREVHEGDPSILAGWPCEYWGVEPFDERRSDCQIRYASIFQIGEDTPSGILQLESAGISSR